MDSLNDKLRDIEQNFLKKKTMKSRIINTTLNIFLKLISFSNIILEIYGAKGLGKSCQVYQLISQLQCQEQLCMLINADFSYDKSFASIWQVDNNNLILVNANKMEEIIEIVSSFKSCYIFIDSIAGLELTKENIDKLVSIIRHNHLGLIYTNQIRNKKNKVSSYGRKTLKLYTDKRIQITKDGLEIIK